MQTWQLGDTRITRIEELQGPLFDPVRFFPDFDRAALERHSAWLYPRHMVPGGNIMASIHAWLIQTPRHRILVDCCIGADKDRMPYRNWHRMQTPFLDNLHAAGADPGEIDFVLCTHLHVDHVGWNTRLANGQWVPTFPNARYLFARAEFEFWQQRRREPHPDEFTAVNHRVFDDSVLPIRHLADLVDGEHEVIADRLTLSPAPGHTPGSVAVCLRAGAQEALFIGDVAHHPLQVYETHWNSAFCELPETARATRRQLLTRCADRGALLLPAHFAGRHAGRVIATDGGFEYREQ
jgi:glyoxylase-like metal-dependent hydrolase (beta-lactamase superfamily II)